MAISGSNPSRHQSKGKNVPKRSSVSHNDSNITSTPSPRQQIQYHHDPSAPIVSYPHRIIFLLESTSNNTKYINIYKDAMNHRATADHHDQLNVFFIDYNQIVDTLDYECVENDDAYRALHERVKIYMLKNGHISNNLMLQLVRHLITLTLASVQRKWNKSVTNFQDATASSCVESTMTSIILTNFFDLAFINYLIGAKVKVKAIVKLNCKKIAQVRDKFVSKTAMAKQSILDEKILTFWQGLHDRLNTAKGSAAFKDVVMYSHKSKYNSFYEPLNFDKIVTMSRKYTIREMSKVQHILLGVETEHQNYVTSTNPTYSLNVNHDYTYYYELYSQHLSKLPEEVVSVPVVLDAIIKTIDPEQLTSEHVDFLFDALKFEDDSGCINYNVCIQYGNNCALAVKKHNLRFTNYIQSVVNVIKTKWKNYLWGLRPLLPLSTEAKYNKIISNIKSQCQHAVSSDDVDIQLCVLGLNQLQSNLDVFRGEKIGLPGLRTKMPLSFRPELVEPADCTTMVQMLEKESESYKKISYVYFEPEDVILVGFYDFPGVTPTRRSSFSFNMPQRPLYAKDYFKYFYNKKIPQCFYTIEIAHQSCLTYREETEEMRFVNDDCSLTVARRAWRFEPDTVCLIYKSKRYEVIRHVTNNQRKADVDNDDDEDYDRFRIFSPGHMEFYIDKSSRGFIGFSGKTVDDDVCTEIISGSNYCLLRQSTVDSDRPEFCRRYGNGRVIVDLPDKNTFTYWAGGKFDSSAVVKATVVHVPKPEASVKSEGAIKSTASKMRGSRSARSTRGGGGGGTPNADGTMAKSPSRMARKDNQPVPSPVNAQSLAVDDETDSVVTEYTYGGTVRTVEFEDGTKITTYLREVPGEPDWVCFTVSGYKYSHPSYGQPVTEDRNGTFTVPGLVSRSPDGSFRLWLGKDAGRIEVTNEAVNVYGVRRLRDYYDGDDPKIATFGWKDSKLLFDKQDGRGNALRQTNVAYDGTVAVDCTVAGGSSSSQFWPEPSVTYFIVKRNMSGFRVLDGRQYNEFTEEIRDRTHTIVNENQNEIVALSVEGDTKKSSTVDSNGFSWFTVFSGQKPIDKNIALSSKLLTSRTFRRVNVDYDPVLDALSHVAPASYSDDDDDDNDHDENVDDDNHLPQRTLAAATRLAVYINVLDYKTVQAMYARGLCGSACRTVSADDKRFTKTLLNPRIALSLRLAQQNEHKTHALEARTRMQRNNFIPFFHYESYEPLRKYFVANKLSYPP